GFSARLGYETQDESDTYGGGFDTWGIGMSYAVNQWAFNLDYYNVDEDNGPDRDAWAAGAYYNVSSAFQVFLELNDADADFDGGDTSFNDIRDDVYWLTGARYFF
ncbi:porin, partial [Halomonas campaniensis]|uniref:porin n=1 Tax=Halomonas campaniensis TaxID=213554 RepID=UPI003970BCD8